MPHAPVAPPCDERDALVAEWVRESVRLVMIREWLRKGKQGAPPDLLDAAEQERRVDEALRRLYGHIARCLECLPGGRSL